ncbi:hypothetical protein EMPS_06326 [Entomortierella parvispora]|uniref:Uncharacterized protein n=1 Tax=Entomortierella parvispora TaxID=205924 RepID=A0A9P3HCQ0_9FUNG|nr:hypothetical protein EMPS_06326 [Entomortierella parvispora]
MKGLSKLFSALVKSFVLIFLTSVAVSNPPPGEVLKTLAIDVGSTATRLSVLVGENGLAFSNTGEPRVIMTGPGTHSFPGPLESNWTLEGFLLIKEGTDEAHYVHPFNTLFNLDYPLALRSRERDGYHDKPSIPGYQAFTLIDITAKYLEKLKTSAESIVRRKLPFTVIVLPGGHNIKTVPKKNFNDSYWGNRTSFVRVQMNGHDPQKSKRVMMSATPQRGFGVWSQVYTRAPAILFPLDTGMEYRRPFLVYHLGSSTFEVSIHRVAGGDADTMSSVYDQHLGGNNFNQRIVDHLLLAHRNKTGQDLSSDDIFLLGLRNKVEAAKQELSVQDWVLIEIESPQSGGQGLSEVLTRTQFEDLNRVLFNKTIAAIDRAIHDSALYTKYDIQDIVLSGGSANIPFLQSTIKDYFGPHKKYHRLSHPENTAVLGAARLGHWYQDERRFTGDVCCLGASTAVVGIETAGGVMFKYTERGDYLTVNSMYTFTTARDHQEQVLIRVYSGEGKWTSENRFLGEARLTGIAPALKDIPQIRVWLVSYGCGDYLNLNVMDVTSRRTSATIIYTNGYGKKSNDEIGAFELEPAGKLILLPSLID